jgi:hypothetical protein
LLSFQFLCYFSVNYFLPKILRHMRQKWTLTKTIKNRAFSAKNLLKTPPNQ